MAILTLSRKVGSGSEEIGRQVARTLRYRFVDKFEIMAEMRAMGEEWEKTGETFDERYPNFWDRRGSSFIGYVALVQWIILNFAAKGNAVIISRGSNFLLKGVPYAYRVRVTAPLEQRIERIMSREGVTHEVAEMLVEKGDHEMSRSIQYNYGKDWDDPAEYDAVVDTGTGTIDQITDNLIEELSRRDNIRTRDMRKALFLRARAYEIRARILTDPKLSVPLLDVRPDGQELVLKGVVENTSMADRIETLARRVAGDIALKIDIQSRR